MRWYWLILVLALIYIPHLFISYGWMQDSVMSDLHLRIVGSRWMDAGMSPYFSQWKPGNDVRMYNPNMFMPTGVNGVTVTPAVLWLQLRLSRMNYCDIKFTWWLVMEGLLFATLLCTSLIAEKRGMQLLTIVIGVLFFCYSRNWWLNVYTGQYYVVFAFIFSVATFMVLRLKKRFVPLFIFPLTVLLRPFFALAIIPWLLKFNRKRRLAFVFSAMLAVGLMVISAPIKIWREYSTAMKVYSSDITGQIEKSIATDYRQEGLPTEDCIYKQPATAGFNAGCLFSIQHYLNLVNVKLNNPLEFSLMLMVAIVFFIVITKPTIISAGNENLLLSSFFLYILSELFTPAYRNPYNMIQYLGIMGVFMNKANGKLMALMLLGLLLNHDFPFRFKYQREIGEAIMLASVYFSLFVRNLQREAVR